MFSKVLLLTSLIFAVSCAHRPKVQTTEDGLHFVKVENSYTESGYPKAIELAEEFCHSKGKKVVEAHDGQAKSRNSREKLAKPIPDANYTYIFHFRCNK